MTDVDNLDELARAITSKSPAIRNYAIAQASATQSQELDIKALKEAVDVLRGSGPPKGPLPPTISQTINPGVTLSGDIEWFAVYDGDGDGQPDDPGSVLFYVDGDLVMTDTDMPFGDATYDTTGLSNGSRTFRVDATDGVSVLATNSVVATVNNVSVGAWVPAPPASYSSSGTFTKQVLVDSGLNTGFVTWTASRQHLVKTSSGVIFIAYSLNGDGNHNNEKWRLKRSNDGGSTWVLVTDSTTAGYPINGGGAPGLEIDQSDNVYVVVSQYRATSPSNIFRVYKYASSNNYASPTDIFTTTLKAANKWGCYWDQTRGWLWMMAWERGPGDSSNDLMAIDQNGVVTCAKKLFGPLDAVPSSTRHADVSYPVLTGTTDGTIIVAWSNEAGSGYISSFPSSTQSYYDVEFVYTADGGTTFTGPNGTISGTVIGDDTAPSNRAAYRVVDQRPWATASYPEFIAATDPAYLGNGGTRWNLNMLESVAFNNNALHFYYMAYSTAGIINPNHRSHTGFNWATKAVDRRTQPIRATTGTSLAMGADVGNFVQDTSQVGRLYFVGVASGAPAVLRSDDGGVSWQRYAVGSPITNLVYTNACRWVQSDGKILACTQSGASIVFLEITPV